MQAGTARCSRGGRAQSTLRSWEGHARRALLSPARPWEVAAASRCHVSGMRSRPCRLHINSTLLVPQTETTASDILPCPPTSLSSPACVAVTWGGRQMSQQAPRPPCAFFSSVLQAYCVHKALLFLPPSLGWRKVKGQPGITPQ